MTYNYEIYLEEYQSSVGTITAPNNRIAISLFKKTNPQWKNSKLYARPKD